jgi:hypothetical protein
MDKGEPDWQQLLRQRGGTVTSKNLSILKAIAIVFLAAGLIGQAVSQSIWTHYFHTLPRSPDPAVGRVYPLNMHGIIRYQTQGERTRLDAVEYSSTGLFFTGLIIGAIQRWKSGKPSLRSADAR